MKSASDIIIVCNLLQGDLALAMSQMDRRWKDPLHGIVGPYHSSLAKHVAYIGGKQFNVPVVRNISEQQLSLPRERDVLVMMW